MIRAHQWHNQKWRPVWIMAFLHDKFSGAVAVIAIPELDDHEWGSDKGMKIEVEKTISQLRIARTRIPLHD